MTVEELAIPTLGSLLWKNITQAAEIAKLQAENAALKVEKPADKPARKVPVDPA